jgi:hypothetical protein
MVWPTRPNSNTGVRGLPTEFESYLSACGFRGALFDQLFQRIERVLVVEADVKACAGFAGDQIDGLVADIDRREFKMRRCELCAALVKRLALQRCDKRNEAANRIFGALRIGDVPLFAADNQMAVERTATAHLDGIAHRLLIARLAQDAVIEFLAALGGPFQQLGRAIDRDAFFVAGNQKRDRALRLAAIGS